jgi:hypothetical protein
MLANGSGVFTDYILFSFGTLVFFPVPRTLRTQYYPVHSFTDSLRHDPSSESQQINR